ncbi:M20/M25/M40 family metallo-hydrolase [Candidatus Falkowbacteria bacterium]|nr:M20/M25/M40 family metallo-hydrolase [Candidatus Falkowbacteria bacterium]
MAHLDVVPADTESFTFEQEGEIVRGRGVFDNKGPAAMLMLLADALQKDRHGPTVKLFFTTDEEIGGETGAKRIASSSHMDNVFAIFIPDGGDYGHITCREKGFIHLKLEIDGQSAHGARPWQGDNAITKAICLYQDLEKLIKKHTRPDDEYWHATINLGYLSGGQAVNQVPGLASMGVDIRLTEQTDQTGLLEEIYDLVGQRARIVELSTASHVHTDEFHPLIQHYKKVMERMTGQVIEFAPDHGASDAKHFTGLNVPIWLQSPRGGGHHGKEEWADIDSMYKMINAWLTFIKEL